MKRKNVVIFHNDLDGECSAAITRFDIGERFLEETVFHRTDYGESPPWKMLRDADSCYIVDFCYSRQDMENLQSMFPYDKLTWIDHHKTSIDAMEGIEMRGVRSIEKSGCILTWDFFFPMSSSPYPVKLVNDRDLWIFEYGDETRNFYEYTTIVDTSPENEIWDFLLQRYKNYHNDERYNDMIRDGNFLREAKIYKLKNLIKECGYEVEIDGYKCYKVNHNVFTEISELGHLICDDPELPDIAWIYNYRIIEGKMALTNSLRSNTIDVGEMARIRGGGGHKAASGWVEFVKGG